MLPHRVGLIGKGPWGMNIRRTLDAMGVTVSAVADRTTGWQHAFTSEPTHIIVAAHPSINLDVCFLAEEKGLPVFVEKPAALCLEHVERMAHCTIPITVGYTYLHATNQEIVRFTERALRSLATGIDCHEWGPLYDWGPHLLAGIICSRHQASKEPLRQILTTFLEDLRRPPFAMTVEIHRILDAVDRAQKEKSRASR